MNASTATLMLHCGARTATLEDIAAVPVPEETKTYKPLPHHDLATNTMRIGQEMMETKGFKVDKAQFGLDRTGNRMFGVVSFANGVQGIGLAIGFRNSYDKSMSAGFAIGGRVFVCDNLAMAGELVVMRKHTGGIIEELRDKLVLTYHRATTTWTKLVEDRQRMQDIPVDDDLAYATMGPAYGRGLISAGQLPKVNAEWKTPRHEEFAPRNLWSLYNAVTEVYKGLPVHRVMERHITFHKFATAYLPSAN